MGLESKMVSSSRERFNERVDGAIHYGAVGLACLGFAAVVSLPIYGVIYGLNKRFSNNRVTISTQRDNYSKTEIKK